MFLKKFLNQPNVVGSVLIALMVCSGFVYAFAFDGFNVETATQGDVEAWLAAAGGGGSGSGEEEDPPSDDEEEDPPSDDEEVDPPPDGEAPPCTCRSCPCGNKVWKQGGKKNKWGWWPPCEGQNRDMPCSSTDCPYDSHSGAGNSDCKCPYHPNSDPAKGKYIRKRWKVCSESNEIRCDGNCNSNQEEPNPE